MTDVTKKLTDFIKPEEETVNLAGRVPRWKAEKLREKMTKDGIKKTQDWLNAAIDKYLEED